MTLLNRLIEFQKLFSRTPLKSVDWESASLAKYDLKEEVLKLKQQPGNPIFVGSRSLIIQLIQLNLIDEFQLCIHPMVEGKGLQLFEGINDRLLFKLIKTKTFKNGAILLYYQPISAVDL